MALSDEFSLIRKISEKVGHPHGKVKIGIGDDTAVILPPRGKIVTTVDCLVENVHFSLKYFSPEDVGYKALAVNLSDIAAMGGKPLYALVSLGVRDGLDDKFILQFYDGLLELAKKFGVQVVGGNITRSRDFFADVTVIGEANEPILRSGALVGDLIGVTGPLGQASLGLQAMLQKAPKEKYKKLIKRQQRPMPRIDAAKVFANSPYVHSLIDVSDGLSSELWHLAKASEVALEIDARRLEVTDEVKAYCKRYKLNPEDFIWNGGEDYELVVTFDPKAEKSLKKYVRVIGRVAGVGASVYKTSKGRRESVIPSGWNHLS